MKKVVKNNSKNIILTPNNNEFDRIWKSFMKSEMKFSLI